MATLAHSADHYPTQPLVSRLQRQKQAWIEFLERYDFTHFFTVKFAQRRKVESERGAAYLRFSSDDYSKAARKLQRSLSVELTGKAYVRKYKKLVPLFMALEGGDDAWGHNCGNYHGHFLLRCPAHVTDDKLAHALQNLWLGSGIATHQSKEKLIDIQPIEPSTFSKLARYLMKQGPDCLDPLWSPPSQQ